MSVIIQRFLLNNNNYDPKQDYRINVQKIRDILHCSEEETEKEIQKKQIELSLSKLRAFEP